MAEVAWLTTRENAGWWVLFVIDHRVKYNIYTTSITDQLIAAVCRQRAEHGNEKDGSPADR